MIINNWRNGFGNDGHTDVLVHSNNIIGGGNNFVDSSPNARTMSIKINGVDSNTQHSNAQHNLGLSSIKFSHPVAACASANLWTNAGKDIGEQDYCFDAWVYSEEITAEPYVDYFYMGYFDANKVDPFNNSIYLQFDNSSQRIDYIFFNNGSAYNIYYNVKAYVPGQWNHFAITRKENWFYFYVNGIQVGSHNYGSVYSFAYIARPIHMLYYNSGDCSNTRKFYVEEWRQSIGSTRWEHNFVPPNRFF